MPKDQITQRVQTAATLLQIDKLLQRKPGQLSGGQRQRVAIGRAITRNPKIFLFDEPLSNLDAELRVQMRIELSKLHKDLKATMIYVTHDQVEAMTMADKIVVLRDGRIEQIGKPLDLYNHPANKFVAGFIGSPRMNFISARISTCSTNHVSVTASGLQETTLPLNGAGLAQGDTVSLGIRPEHLELDAAGEWTLTVDLVEQLGGTSFIHGTLPSSEALSIAVNGQTGVSHGQPIRIRPKPGMVHLFSSTEGERALPPSSPRL
jgi:ABC-type sugar transport system ATPase subunit